jgi:hypothetical protein
MLTSISDHALTYSQNTLKTIATALQAVPPISIAMLTVKSGQIRRAHRYGHPPIAAVL